MFLAYDEIFVDGGAAIKIGHACLLPSLSLAMSWRAQSISLSMHQMVFGLKSMHAWVS